MSFELEVWPVGATERLRRIEEVLRRQGLPDEAVQAVLVEVVLTYEDVGAEDSESLVATVMPGQRVLPEWALFNQLEDGLVDLGYERSFRHRDIVFEHPSVRNRQIVFDRQTVTFLWKRYPSPGWPAAIEQSFRFPDQIDEVLVRAGQLQNPFPPPTRRLVRPPQDPAR